MEIKIGDGNRIVIPLEIRTKLNLSKGDAIDITYDDKKIIITKVETENDNLPIEESENITDTIVSNIKDIKHDEPVKDSDLQNELIDVREEFIKNNPNLYWENGVLKQKLEPSTKAPEQPQVNEEKQDDKLYCDCGNEIIDCKLIINEKRVCRACADRFKNNLKKEIIYRQRLKKLQNK